jgi:hypothetical protein
MNAIWGKHIIHYELKTRSWILVKFLSRIISETSFPFVNNNLIFLDQYNKLSINYKESEFHMHESGSINFIYELRDEAKLNLKNSRMNDLIC